MNSDGRTSGAAQVRWEQHDGDAPETQKVSVYGWDSTNTQKRRISINEDGVLRIQIVAEDVDNPGVFVAVQGQFNADGNFELLTAGSGTSSTVGDGLWNSTDTLWNATDVLWNQT